MNVWENHVEKIAGETETLILSKVSRQSVWELTMYNSLFIKLSTTSQPPKKPKRKNVILLGCQKELFNQTKERELKPTGLEKGWFQRAVVRF